MGNQHLCSCTLHLKLYAPTPLPVLACTPPRHPYEPAPSCPYSLHHKIDVTSASKNYSVWAAFGSGIAGASTAPERAWPTDPRLPALGRRSEQGGWDAIWGRKVGWMCKLCCLLAPLCCCRPATEPNPGHAFNCCTPHAAILPRGSAPTQTASASEYACWRIKQVCRM